VEVETLEITVNLRTLEEEDLVASTMEKYKSHRLLEEVA